MRRRCYSAGAAILLSTLTAFADAPAVGDPAPQIKVGSWFNVPGDGAITDADLRGQVVMIEFWGTY